MIKIYIYLFCYLVQVRMFPMTSTTSNCLSQGECIGLHSWEESWVIQKVEEEFSQPGSWSGEPGVRDPVLSPSSFHFWLASFSRQTLFRWQRCWENYSPAPGFITSYLATTKERESSTHSVYMSIPGWILIGCSWPTYPLPPPQSILVSRWRDITWLVSTGSHDYYVIRKAQGLLLQEGNGGDICQAVQTTTIIVHHWIILPPHLSLIFYFWLLCTASPHLKEKDWLYQWSAIW